ncbi:MAG TPA: nuclear transport factor 2 family protein, partial [Segetibacter sp.]
MYTTGLLSRAILVIVVTIISMTNLIAQEKKVAPATQELFNQITKMDSLLFGAYNTQNLVKIKLLFTEDLEWFQDNGGLLSPKIIFEAFESNFKKEHKLTRTLVKGSLEVYPIKDYGAIEIGTHKFSHIENGKEEIAT